MGEVRSHWLAALAASRFPGQERPDLDPTCSTEEAWRTVEEFYQIDSLQISELVAKAYHLQVADMAAASANATRLVPGPVARSVRVFPLRENYRELFVATSDPTALDMEQAIAFSSGRDVVFEVASPQSVTIAIDAAYGAANATGTFFAGLDAVEDTSIDIVEDESVDDVDRSEVDAAPVVKLANLIIRDAVKQGASDIHLQPTGQSGIVRFRVDGMLRNYMKMPEAALSRVISRIKVVANLDIAVRMRPQDGRVRVNVSGRNYDLRVSTVPARNSEKAVIRLLDSEGAPALTDVGFSPDELKRLNALLSARDGIILVTGPTGSGKTTTLYAALRELAREEVNIMTVEDPIEYELPGITQIQVQEKQGVTFASALRAILRQDPDIVLVGEIRDMETAEMAVQASLTGHLVLATLHTNDAVASVQRLVDIGLNRTSIADALRGVVAQRLVRTLCEGCAVDTGGEFTAEEVELTGRQGTAPLRRAAGCDTCGHTGYRGRAPIIDVVAFDERLKECIAGEGTSAELRELARSGGGVGLREVGMGLVKAGTTTLQEIDRVLGEETHDESDSGEPEAEVEVAVVAAAIAPEVQAAPTPPAIPRTAAPVRKSMEGFLTFNRALVVDDDATTRAIVKALIENEGLSVDQAADGTDAVRLLKMDPLYDIVVLDLDMPLLGGREVLQVARATVSTATLPIIVLTGTPDPSAESQLLESGADDYIRKPIDAQRFVSRFRAVLRRTSQRG